MTTKLLILPFYYVCHFKVLGFSFNWGVAITHPQSFFLCNTRKEPNLGIQLKWPQQSGCHSDCTACRWPLLCMGTARWLGRMSATQRRRKSTRTGSKCLRLQAGSGFPAADRTRKTLAEHLASMYTASYLSVNQSWVNLHSCKDTSLTVIAKEELFSAIPISICWLLSRKQWCCWETLMAKYPGVDVKVTLQRHSPEVLLQSLWKPRLVSQLQGPHAGLPHHPWGQGFSTLGAEKTKLVTQQRPLFLKEWQYWNMALVWMTLVSWG